MNKLPEEFKTKWLAALRSGEYKQGQRKLCITTDTGEKFYCCLGVAYRVVKGVDPPAIPYINPDLIDTAGLPDIIVGSGSEGGINSDTASIRYKLTNMNDDDFHKKSSFSEIADYIEQNL